MENIIRKLDFITLVIFNDICQTGSLSKAAEKNAIAVSAASKRLTDLEQAVSTKLFVRDARGMNITPAGESLLYHSRGIIDSIYKASIELDEFKLGLKGFVRIQASLAAIIQFLPADLHSFIDLNPFIKVELEQQISKEVVKNVQNRHADLGICVADIHEPELEYEIYRQDQLVVVAQNQQYLVNHGIVDLPSALQHDVIGLLPQSAINQRIKTIAETINTPLKLRMLVSSFDALCLMVEVGMGIGIMPLKAFEKFARPMGLVSLEINEPWATRNLYVVSYPDSSLSPVALLLKQHLLHTPL